MVPIIPAYIPDLSKKKILLSRGLKDTIGARIETENLYKICEKNNAITTLKWQSSGHNLTQEDILIARKWLSNNFSDEKQ